MKAKYLILPLAALALSATSCKDDMDYHEYSVVDKEWVELNFANVGGFMTEMYKLIPYDFGNYSAGAMYSSATDESEYSHMGNAIEDFYNGGWTATNAKQTQWTNMYKGIQSVNRFLADFQGLTFDELKLNADYRQQMYRYNNYPYEARFLRAYFYFVLVRQYGGVPLIAEVMDPNEINQMSRNTSDEIFQYIFDECDAIKDEIIADYAQLGDMALGETQSGRAGKLAVLALRARAALYWASPLFNESGDQSRYLKASQYHQELFDACEVMKKGLTASYNNLWNPASYSAAAIEKELLFCYRYYNGASGDHLVEGYNFPVGIEGGNGGNCPTQNLVDAYDMKNGKSIDDPTSGYDPQNPYKNRDPRLAFTIAVNGDKWPPSYSGTVLQTYNGGTNGQPIPNATTTGYYLKKLCNGNLSLAANGRLKDSFHTYLNFRLGGAYLDYAEAAFKATGSADAAPAGCKMTAREAVNLIRKRAKMPDVTETGDAFWAKYQNERFVELCFEGHRFWDVRRWKEGPKFFSSITRAIITINAEGKVDYTGRQTVNRQWNDRNYLFPIPQTEIMKNPNLTQNPGW